MTDAGAEALFRERLWPTPWLYVALLLLIPAVALVLTPLNAPIAVPTAVLVFLVIAGLLTLTAPTISVEDGEVRAGRARIPVTALGSCELLGQDELRHAIGPGLDARSYLVVRGWVHRGVKIAVTDPLDPAPAWILTTRRPDEFAAALDRAQRRGAA